MQAFLLILLNAKEVASKFMPEEKFPKNGLECPRLKKA